MKYKLTKEQLDKLANKIKGGFSDNKSLEDIAKKHNVSIEEIQTQLNKGIKIEMEHTNDKEIAREIALDHLYELPDYYSKLNDIEESEDILNESDFMEFDIVMTPKGRGTIVFDYGNGSFEVELRNNEVLTFDSNELKKISESDISEGFKDFALGSVMLMNTLSTPASEIPNKNSMEMTNQTFKPLNKNLNINGELILTLVSKPSNTISDGVKFNNDNVKKRNIKNLSDVYHSYIEKDGKFIIKSQYYSDSVGYGSIKEKTDYSKENESGLHGWFSRRGGEGSKGWIDCNTCREVNGKIKCKPCGREKGEERSKYPACRPTPSACKTKGKGETWGKKSESIMKENIIGKTVTISKSDYSEVTGEVVKVSNQNININLGNNIKGKETNVWVTVKDSDGNLHTGTIKNISETEQSIKVTPDDLKDTKNIDAVKDLLQKDVPVVLTKEGLSVNPEGELEGIMEFDINDVSTAMDIVKEYESNLVWYEDKLINKIINFGVKMKWLFRPSVTQVEWTEKGIEKLNSESEGLVEKKKDRCYNIAKRKYDKNSAYRSGSIVRCRKGQIWKNESKEEIKKEIKEMVENHLKPTIKKGDFIKIVLGNN